MFQIGCFPFREPERSGVREHINMKIVCEQTVGRLTGEVNKTKKGLPARGSPEFKLM